MEHLKLSGTPYEIGREHGHLLAGLIPRVIDRCGRISGDDAPEVRRAARAMQPALQRACPELLEEMRGIAAGAGQSFEDVFMLNCMYDAQGDALPSAAHCTAIGLPGTTSGPLVAKTDDVPLEEREFETFFRIRPRTGHAMVYYGYGGTVWNQGGLNAAGLAVAMTGLPPAGPRQAQGLPSLLFLREVLQRCATIDEAVTFAEAHPLRSYGCMMMLADAGSEDVAAVEIFPSQVGVRRSSKEALVRTNHPQCEATAAVTADAAWWDRYGSTEFMANSRSRAANAAQLVNEVPASVAGLKQMLADHAQPGGICQHGAADLHTSIAMIMIPCERTLLAAEGYGCGEYTEYTL